ncbi:MAG: RNA-binding S4 domain-containing protein [Bacteroidota bacterium]
MEEQRIDKWLWCVRAFKTRSQATDACKGGLVKLNEAEVKPSKDLKKGDRISIRKGPLTVLLEVKEFPKSRLGPKLVADYFTDHTPQEEIDRVKMIRDTAFVVRDKGAGRPTKKDRRDLDSWGLWD